MSVRRVALVQAHFRAWDAGARGALAAMPGFLRTAADLGADLAVFPEAFPFGEGSDGAPGIDRAKADLAALPCPDGLAFIAGGYVFDESGHLRNVVFLVHGRDASQRYFKQVPWAGIGENETEDKYKYRIKAVRKETAIVFRWSGGSCAPLICADVYGPTDADRNQDHEQWLHKQLNRIRHLKPNVIVVPSYAGYIEKESKERWQQSLCGCANSGGAPVAFCNFAGKDGKFGGGGSALYLPREAPTPPTERGVYVVDLPKPPRRGRDAATA